MTDPDIFEDPRSKPRKLQQKEGGLEELPEAIPAAEDDWYLKRMPKVGYIGTSDQSGTKK